MMTTIDEIFELQKKQIMASFYGEGPWVLDPSVRAKYALTKDQWDIKTSKEKEDYFLDFCKYLPPTRPTTITDREKLIELSAKVCSIKGKENQRKRARTERTKPKFQGNAKQQRTDFMKEFDDLVAKDLQTKCQQKSAEATNVNEVEVTMDVDTQMSDDVINTETSAHSNNQVNSKKGGDRRKKHTKNSEGRYVCNYCDKTYSQTGNLNLHVKKAHGTAV